MRRIHQVSIWLLQSGILVPCSFLHPSFAWDEGSLLAFEPYVQLRGSRQTSYPPDRDLLPSRGISSVIRSRPVEYLVDMFKNFVMKVIVEMRVTYR